MKAVEPPIQVGDLHWPVLSAVRVGTAAEPAEFTQAGAVGCAVADDSRADTVGPYGLSADDRP